MNDKVKVILVLGLVLCLFSCGRDSDNMDVVSEIEQQKIEQFLLSKGFVRSNNVDANAKSIATLEEAKKLVEELENFEKMNFMQDEEEFSILEERNNNQEMRRAIYRDSIFDNGQGCVQSRRGYSWTFKGARAGLFSHWNLFIYRGDLGRLEEVKIRPSGTTIGWYFTDERYLVYSRTIGSEVGTVTGKAIVSGNILGMINVQKEYRFVFDYFINGCSATLRTSEF